MPQRSPPAWAAALTAFVREAQQASKEASDLIQATGCHRRDGELNELRPALDALAM